MVLTKIQKQEKVARLSKTLASAKVIGVVSLQNLPSRHYNAIKSKLRGKADVFVTRASLLRRALKESNAKAYDGLSSSIDKSGAVALLVTDLDPFKIAKLLRQNKSKSPAKAGMIANADIVVPAGETNLAPGPVLTELKQAKINAKIQGTKIVIQADATVAKKGEPVPESAAKILGKLGIEPFEVGISLSSAYADGMVYTSDVLDVDDAYYLDQLKAAHSRAVNLAVFAEIFNEVSTPVILASAQAKALALQKVVADKSPKEAAPAAPAAQ